VVKVESIGRPDGARFGPGRFYDLLHAGHESVALDFTTQREELSALIKRADVVLEASRPRALRQLGIDAAQCVADGTIWCSITAYGRAEESRIGFGDDVAAGAGLISWIDGIPYPVGDAIADPLAGAHAAAAVAVALNGDRGCLLDVSMHDVAAAAAAMPNEPTELRESASGWEVVIGDMSVTVEPPRSRLATGSARALGADTAAVLAEVRESLSS
jgi:crotonobetainyl-CoA:carnitine CoA-transferase CaiB-like acyl-CoA transferase